jgi:uncharacterized protein (DUF58 family)
MGLAVGLTVGILAALVGAAGWRLGATNRGLACLAVAAALGIGGRLAGVEEFVLVAVALGVLLAVGPIVLWHRAERSTGTMQIELRPSAHEIPVGGFAAVLVSVTNSGPRSSAPMRLERPDEEWRLARPGFRRRISEPTTFPSLSEPRARRARGWRGRVARGVRVPTLGPGQRAELEFAVPSSVRGVLTLRGLRLWCQDAFELFAYQTAVSTEASIVVVPEVKLPRRVVSGVLQPAGRIEWAPPASGEAQGGPGFDLSGLRPYVPGDRLRLLHWPTLARTGELLVRDFEGSGTDSVTVIMDDRAGVVSRSDFEAIVSTTAGVGRQATRSGLGLELRTPGGANVSFPSGPMLEKALLRLLATLDLVEPRTGRNPVSAYGLGRSDDNGGELSDNLRVVVSSADAVSTLPEILRRSSTVVIA